MNRLQRRQAERQAARKPAAAARITHQPHAQNRLLLLKNPQRLPEKAILDSRIKLHLYLPMTFPTTPEEKSNRLRHTKTRHEETRFSFAG